MGNLTLNSTYSLFWWCPIPPPPEFKMQTSLHSAVQKGISLTTLCFLDMPFFFPGNSYPTKDFEEVLDSRHRNRKVCCMGYLFAARTPKLQSFWGCLVFGDFVVVVLVDWFGFL